MQVSVTISGFTRLFDNDLSKVLDTARVIDDSGAHQLVLADHVVMGPRTDRYPFGTFPYGAEEPWPEPITLLAAVAAVTARVRLGTGILITPLPGARDLKPGSATLPFFGVQPALLDEKGNELHGAAEGALVIKASWPGQMRTVYGDHQRFIDTYFKTYPGKYFTGDGARRDEDGYYWITGRVDDVINVSGHRIGTAEVESALVAHKLVAEAAVVGFPHDIKGQGIYAYVTLNAGLNPSEELRKELVAWVRKEIGPIATPDAIQWAPGLPKTRSGKIMRRILRKIASGEYDGLGDVTTLAEPEVVEALIAQHRARTSA